ncbi:MAG: FHA domain-containing protein [Deltaproteobacteria bacterium]|nr:FHA domain-containing protein [Deltaproteobacteria bacterium]
MMKIFLMNGSEKGKIYALSEDRVFIGRSRENHVFLSDKSVSRKHLEIIKRGEHFFGIDLESTNGTFIGSKPMVPGKECEIGEGVPIG